jgi:hypothetical protein
MISNEQIKNIIKEGAKSNYNISVRDIAYALLSKQFEDPLVAYKCLFGNDVDYNQDYHETYSQTNAISYISTYIDFNENKGGAKNKKQEDITFEENKAYMLKLKKDTEEAMSKGEIDKKDGLKILADLSVKLNDKFNINENSKDQVIFVNAKYDSICPNCGKEVSRKPISKEEAMDMYNLEEKE